MKKNYFEKMYDQSWMKKDSDFNFYERNWILPEYFNEKGKVLDVACGSGTVGVWLQKRGFEVYGFDISKEALNMAKKKGYRHLSRGDATEKWPFGDETFNYVFLGDIIEHVLDPLYLLSEAYRVLKNNGNLIVSTPNYGYWYYRLAYLKLGRVPETEGVGRPPWRWEHIRFFAKKTLLDYLKEGRFETVLLRGSSKRRLDKLLVKYFPQLFGMILTVKAKKRGQ